MKFKNQFYSLFHAKFYSGFSLILTRIDQLCGKMDMDTSGEFQNLLHLTHFLYF